MIGEIINSMNTIYAIIIISVQFIIILIIGAILANRRKRLSVAPVLSPFHQATEHLTYKSSAKVHIGKRGNQEDCIEILDPYKQTMNVDYMAILCDGMGGIEKGEVASSFAISEMRKLAYCSTLSHRIPNLLKATIENISAKLYGLSLQNAIPGGIGTTLVTVLLDKGNLYWATVGDSKLYLYRDNVLAQINQQHNYLCLLLDEVSVGSISRDEALLHGDGEKLVSYLGQKEVSMVDQNVIPFKLHHKDVYILCSDGVFGTISDKEIKRILEINRVEDVANEVIKRVLSYNKEHQDNMSVIALEYLGQ